MTKPTELLSPAQRTKIEKKKLAAADAAKAMSEVGQDALAIRTNMQRLKALRLARDAELGPSHVQPKVAKRSRRPKT